MARCCEMKGGTLMDNKWRKFAYFKLPVVVDDDLYLKLRLYVTVRKEKITRYKKVFLFPSAITNDQSIERSVFNYMHHLGYEKVDNKSGCVQYEKELTRGGSDGLKGIADSLFGIAAYLKWHLKPKE